jgi:hypothetical protein
MSDRQKCSVCSDFMPHDDTAANRRSGLVMKGSPVRVRPSASSSSQSLEAQLARSALHVRRPVASASASAIATATSTALEAAIPAVIVSGDVTTARIASAPRASGRERGTCLTASPLKMIWASRKSAGPPNVRIVKPEDRVVVGMGDRELVADGDGARWGARPRSRCARGRCAGYGRAASAAPTPSWVTSTASPQSTRRASQSAIAPSEAHRAPAAEHLGRARIAGSAHQRQARGRAARAPASPRDPVRHDRFSSPSSLRAE